MVNNNKLSYIFGVVLLLVIVFVIAAPTSIPSSLIFRLNTTTLYDEGNFSFNWSGGDLTNFSVNIFADGLLYKHDWNDSATGYTFNNWTEANYTFIVSEVYIANASEGTNSSNLSIYVDRTAPVISLPEYTNGTAKKNTATLTLNVSVIDALSGETGSVCIFDINGTNQSIAVDTNWCNMTVGNLTGLADGNQTIKVYVNDTVNILGLNNSFVVQVDTTGPLVTHACTPEPVVQGSTLTCTCSVSDATSGINTS
ncbi:MAG: hypothetical protein NUV37_03475, partial [Nanoarchaeota archaeon]|nr:hypothetical protein [Nanoarchaeota archaeon]